VLLIRRSHYHTNYRDKNPAAPPASGDIDHTLRHTPESTLAPVAALSAASDNFDPLKEILCRSPQLSAL
jgi:hypothetical protein